MIIAPNLVPWDFEKIFSLEIAENDVCLGVASKQLPFFQEHVLQENVPMPPMSGIGPGYMLSLCATIPY